MKIRPLNYLILVSVFWAGMLGAISFLEAPVKFTAPSLTLAVGLDVGRHVFQAFNKVEIVLATLLLVQMIRSKAALIINMLGSLVITLLLLECVWLLPILDERALTIIAGNLPGGNSPHIYYILFDGLKLIGLLSLALFAFRENHND